ncbi:hypothetical protein [Allosalinactinospora lopnorensis]|uniref:hypothetical protein n=1 Tax=Allosalinactinospora lopnorensis TaxID=1352348 RepID=UPI000623F4C6|nr:hypothetical protein [Allosalinactinospora lopnorensis]
MPASPRPWRTGLPSFCLVSAGAVLLLSACSAGGAEPGAGVAAERGGVPDEAGAEGDTSGFRQGPVPDERHPEVDEADLPEEPEPDAPLSDRMAWAALKEISEFAGKADPGATVACPEIEGESGESVTCEVSYFGAEIEYRIDIEENGSLLRYDATANGMPLLRDVMEAGLRSYEDSEYTVCEMDEIELVTPNEDSGIECRALDEERGTVVSYVILPTVSGSPSFLDEDTELS